MVCSVAVVFFSDKVRQYRGSGTNCKQVIQKEQDRVAVPLFVT